MMNGLGGIWRRLVHSLQRDEDGDGMNGLWQVSRDLKKAVRDYNGSRVDMKRSEIKNIQAAHHLENTIQKLKQPKPPFKLEERKREEKQ